jgi:DNA-binding response OmpR family regulator
MRAVIYDDDDDLAQECAEALRMRGYETRTRNEEPDFAVLLEEFAPDLILLDVHMPDFNGVEALLMLAKSPRKRETAVIMMSGARDGLLDAGRALGEAHNIHLLGTLDKPFALQALDRLLQGLHSNAPAPFSGNTHKTRQ